jgi:archaellum component FlaC
MASKRKQKTIIATADSQDAEPVLLRMSEIELLKTEKLAATIRAAKSEAMQAMAMKRAFLLQIDPKNQIAGFDFQITNLNREQQTAQSELEELRKNIEARLGIDLKQYAYDDVSGVLRPLPTDNSAPEQKEK